MKDLLKLIDDRKWHHITKTYQPSELAKLLPFKEAMILGNQILGNEEGDDDLRIYATTLIDEIRKRYPEDWNVDWRNDVFLGDAFFLAMKYDENYQSYKRSFDTVFPRPHALLVSMAGCYSNPDCPVTIEDAEKWVREALKKEISMEAVVLIRGICKQKGDMDQFSYWDNIFKRLENKKSSMKHKWPSFIEEKAKKP
jgi:hypothetical protein